MSLVFKEISREIQGAKLAVLAGVVLAVSGNVALAQDAIGEAVLEEIIVTAQKREQSAQKVPVSVFALSGDALRQSGIDSVESLRDIAAGVEIISVTPGAVQMNVRGVTNLAVGQLDVTAAVGYYIDETPLSSFSPSELPDAALWDVERVEVLRGPQGTLFGESSMGGTIRVITRKPDPSSAHGSVAASFESITNGGTGWGLRGTFNAPLIDDELAIRVNVSRTDRDGWIDVPDVGATDANALQQTRARIALGWTYNSPGLIRKPIPTITLWQRPVELMIRKVSHHQALLHRRKRYPQQIIAFSSPTSPSLMISTVQR